MSEEEKWKKKRGKVAAAAAVDVMESTMKLVDDVLLDDPHAMTRLAFLVVLAKGLAAGERK
jgi:hypothetical protein